jgi:hypothetical protein
MLQTRPAQETTERSVIREKMKMGEKPEAILGKWFDHVNGMDVEGVVGMYGDDSTLLPTFSPRCLATREEIRKYFENLAAKSNLKVELDDEAPRVDSVGGSTYVLSGRYTFSYRADEGGQAFPSRFTFVLDTSRESPIVHHHSSQVP